MTGVESIASSHRPGDLGDPALLLGEDTAGSTLLKMGDWTIFSSEELKEERAKRKSRPHPPAHTSLKGRARSPSAVEGCLPFALCVRACARG